MNDDALIRLLNRVSAGLMVVAAALLAVAIFFAPACADAIDDLPAGHWLELENTRLSSADPCPTRDCSYSATEGQTAVTNDWTGAAYDTASDRLIAWGGGHSGYAGNEVYALDIDDPSSGWYRLSEPSENVACDHSTDSYPDGRPCSMHTYDYVEFHPGSQSFVLLGGASPYPQGGGGAPYAHLFRDGAWQLGARRDGGSTLTGATSAYDAERDLYWLIPAYNGRIASYDPVADAWAQYGAFNITIDGASAIGAGRLVFVDARGTRAVYVYDPATPDVLPARVETTGPQDAQQSGGLGFEYDQGAGVFVAWVGGSSVYTLSPDSWQWSAIAAQGDVAPTSKNANGTYSRWRYVPSRGVFVLLNRTTDNVFVYRLADKPARCARLECSPRVLLPRVPR